MQNKNEYPARKQTSTAVHFRRHKTEEHMSRFCFAEGGPIQGALVRGVLMCSMQGGYRICSGREYVGQAVRAGIAGSL